MARSTFLSGTICAIWLVAFATNLSGQSDQATAASYVEMGDKFVRQGELKLAIGAYNVAIDAAPDFALPYFRRGLARQSRGEFSLAIADYSKTIEIVPQCAEAYANRGYLYGIQREEQRLLPTGKPLWRSTHD
jgi:tetratricopeptide (TPR) repeat protein